MNLRDAVLAVKRLNENAGKVYKWYAEKSARVRGYFRHIDWDDTGLNVDEPSEEFYVMLVGEDYSRCGDSDYFHVSIPIGVLDAPTKEAVYALAESANESAAREAQVKKEEEAAKAIADAEQKAKAAEERDAAEYKRLCAKFSS